MANLCSFCMQVKGDRKNIEKFYDAITQNKDVWMRRGADAYIEYTDKSCAFISGSCKWSIRSSLIDNAISMRKQKETGKGKWVFYEEDYLREYITLWEACEKYHVNMEVYSEEPGCEFSEHYKYENGNITEECVDYREVFNEETEDWEPEGGFENWDFNLASVE